MLGVKFTVTMSEIKFTFYRDQWGVHVYYPEMEGNPTCPLDDLYINNDIVFDNSECCVVPAVEKISAGEIQYEFKIIDIEYPADERIIPLRHIGGMRTNFFSVDGNAVAVNMLHNLCKKAGLTPGGGGIRQYQMNRYFCGADSAKHIYIEGKDFSHFFTENPPSAFRGNLLECREYIHQLEHAAHLAVGSWLANGKTAAGLTVGFVQTHLETIQQYVTLIKSKVVSRHYHDNALIAIREAISEVAELSRIASGFSEDS